MAKGHHHGSVQLQGREFGNDLGISHRDRCADLKAQGQGHGMGCRGFQILAATSGGWGLGIDHGDLVSGLHQGREAGSRNVRCSKEGEAHGLSLDRNGGLRNEGLCGADQLLDLGHRPLPLQTRKIVDEKHALKVVHLVLNTDRE